MIVVIPAAGVGSRFSSALPKQYTKLGSNSIISVTISRFLKHPLVSRVVVAISKEDELFNVSDYPVGKVEVCVGGASRAESVYNALKYLQLAGESLAQYIAIHDAVRPFFSYAVIYDLHHAASQNTSGAIAAMPATDTVKMSSCCGDSCVIAETIDREHIWLAQTPQVFSLGCIFGAYDKAKQLDRLSELTDEASAIEKFGTGSPSLVKSSPDNIKITWPTDLLVAQTIYKQLLLEEGL